MAMTSALCRDWMHLHTRIRMEGCVGNGSRRSEAVGWCGAQEALGERASARPGRQTGGKGQRTDRQTDTQTHRHTDGHTDTQTRRQTDRQTDTQTYRQTDRQAGRQTDS